MTKLCLCLTARTIAEDLALLDKYRNYIDLAELRVDCLIPAEQLLIRRFPERAGLPVILTVRRDVDGGFYRDEESTRILLLAKGLSFAEPDTRRNFAYIDIESDLDAPSLEEAARAFGTRIIRSYHSKEGSCEDIVARLRSLYHVGDEIAKVALNCADLSDVRRIIRAGRETAALDKIIIGMGQAGTLTRIFAKTFHNYLTFCAPFDMLNDEGMATASDISLPLGAPGQLGPRDLADFYNWRRITEEAKIYCVTGFPLTATSSPAFFNEVFRRENMNAVYAAVPSPSIEEFLEAADEIGIAGASITVPHKEKILPYLAESSPVVKQVGACNTIVRAENGWHGYNTDTRGFTASLLHFLARKKLSFRGVTIIGAGGAARAVAAEIARLGAHALILNRDPLRAFDLARRYNFAWGGLDAAGVRRINWYYRSIIIQSGSAGMEPDASVDPLELYHFHGDEAVFDVIYKPAKTKLLRRAEAAGCRIQNGLDMLRRQAQHQYQFFFGEEYPEI